MRRAHLRRLPLLAGGLGVCSVLAVVGTTPTTSSFFYDVESVTISARAGTWDAGPPVECQEVMDRPQATLVKGDDRDNALGSNEPPDGNHPQVVMGLGGNDTLRGGNQSDCLVGGTGHDQLIANSDDPKGHAENSKDILLGGPGDDHLKSGNGKDYLDGGPGTDTCEGDNGKDTFVSCEVIIGPTALASSTTSTTQQTTPDPLNDGPAPAAADQQTTDLSEAAVPAPGAQPPTAEDGQTELTDAGSLPADTDAAGTGDPALERSTDAVAGDPVPASLEPDSGAPAPASTP